MYPSLTDYISAIELAQDTLATLNYLRPVRKPNGQPFFSSGNFAIVFKMEDTRTGEHMALKCFLRDVPDRARRLRLIAEYIQDNPSPYLVAMTYLTNELWVDCRHCDNQEFDVVLMPWVEGMTLGEYVGDLCNADDWRHNSIVGLAKRFDSMAGWLKDQSFAHGDLKPDNIIVDGFGNLKMIDYDGCFIPALTGKNAIEIGTFPYRHPKRLVTHFDKYIDDVALIVLSLELHALVIDHSLKKDQETLVLDQQNICKQTSFQTLWRLSKDVAVRVGLLLHAIQSDIESTQNLEWLKIDDILLDSFEFTRAKDYIEHDGKRSYKYGYSLGKLSEVVIPTIYSDTKEFSEGLGAVKQNNKWGFINKLGKIIIPFEFDYVRSFSGKIAIIGQNDKVGCIDQFGEIIIPIAYNDICDFRNDVARASWAPFKHSIYEKWGVIDKKGNVIIPLVYNTLELLSEELVRVRLDKKWGLMSLKGHLLSDMIYDRIDPFEDGLAAVKQDEKWGFMNENGEIIIPVLYKGPMGYVNFKDGLARVKQNDKWGIINTKGHIIIELIYDNIGDIEDGMIWVKHNNKCGFLNEKGQAVIPLIYDDASYFYHGVAKVNQDYFWGLINKLNQTIAPLVYDDITDIICFENSENINGLMKVKVNGLFGLINKTGNLVAEIMYDSIHSFRDGFAMVQDSHEYCGILDLNGKLIIPVEYWEIQSFSEGLIAVKKNKKWGYLDENAETIIPLKYDSAFSFHNGWAAISIERKRGFVDRFGNEDWEKTWELRESTYVEWESRNYY